MVHHDKVLATAYYTDQQIVGYHVYCRACGMDLTLTYGGAGCGDAPAHLMAERNGAGAGYVSKPVYEEVQVPYEYVKEPEYDEVVGKKCRKCGMTK